VRVAGRTRPAATRTPPDLTTLNSQEKSATLYFDPARALVQDGPNRDTESIRHLDTADRLAPIRIRNDPVARDLVVTLDRRAPRRRRGAIKRILELNPTHRLVSGQLFGPGFCDSAASTRGHSVRAHALRKEIQSSSRKARNAHRRIRPWSQSS
jgi:hypothetical protein